MLGVLVSSLLAASPASLASLGFQTVNVPQNVGDFALQHLSERLGQLGVQVITPAEIQALLGLERQKQLLGCSEQATSCTAELADALGAEASLLGTVARLGDTLELSIKVVSNRTGARRAGFTERVQGEGALFAVMDRAAESLAEQLRPPPPPGSDRRGRALVPALVGGVALLAAGASYGLAREAHLDLTDPARPAVANGAAKASTGQAWQVTGAVSTGVAVAAAAVATWLFVTGAPTTVAPSVGLWGGAPSLAVTGSFP